MTTKKTKLVNLLTVAGHSDIALEALEKMAMPRRKPLSKSATVILEAVQRLGAELDDSP